MSVHIQIERFEGPLSLLLHLIRREEMDIFDINIHQITKQYMDYIKAMKKLNLELAGEFIAMAATLIHIKSRMLLPQYNEDGELIENDDPRKELVNRLLEYERFQEAGKDLYARPLLGREVWTRGVRTKVESEADEEIITEDNALFSLISAYRFAIKQMKKAVHKVGVELQSISERIIEMKDRLVVGRRTLFSELIDHKQGEERRGQVLVTFLSLLELGKIGFVHLFQSENFADIHIETKKRVDGDVLKRVEEYDAPILVDGETGEEQLSLDEEESPQEEDFEAHVTRPEEVPGEAPLIEAATDEEILAEEQRLGIIGVSNTVDEPDVPAEDIFSEFRIANDVDPQPDGAV